MLKSFLNKIIKEDGFLLETSDKKIYTIGSPVKEKPVKLKLHSKLIEYKLALFSDFYFYFRTLNTSVYCLQKVVG